MPKSGPRYFFKVFFPDQSSNFLRIPPAFRQHIEAECSKQVSLKGPSGCTWQVNLVKNSDGFIFEDGWKGFSADQSLAMGDFLLFRYDGNSRFRVLVFDSTACEKEKAFLARPRVEEENVVVEESEESDEDVSMEDEEEEEEEEENKPFVHFTKRKFEWILKKKGGTNDLLAVNDLSKKKKKNKHFEFKMDQSISKNLNLCSAHLSPNPRDLVTVKQECESYSPSGSNEYNRGPPTLQNEDAMHINSAFSIKCRTLHKPYNSSQAHLSPNPRDLVTVKQECESYSPPGSNEYNRGPPTLQNEDAMHRNSAFSIKCRTLHKPYNSSQVSGSSPPSIKKNKFSNALEFVKSNETVRGRGSVFRAGSLISQRRPVTAEEVGRTLERAMSFKSEHPFAIAVMQDSHVYTSFFLYVPNWFAKKHLPKENTVLTVWDPFGKPWKITYVSYSTRGGLSGGWGKFSYANNLEKHDVCVFELIQKDHLKVHIYRVVEEIAPLIRCRRDTYN